MFSSLALCTNVQAHEHSKKETPIEYTLKTTYENGKVVTGNVYHQKADNILDTEQYLDGEKIGFTIDIFAIHYFNRITFKIEVNQLSIKTLNSNDEVKIYKKDGWAVSDYYIDGVDQQKSQPLLIEVKEATSYSTSLFYYDEENTLRQYKMFLNEEQNPVSNNDLLLNYYPRFSFEYKEELTQLMKTIEQYFIDSTINTEEPIETLFSEVSIPYNQKKYWDT